MNVNSVYCPVPRATMMAACLLLIACLGCSRAPEKHDDGLSKERTPQEELSTFQIADGLKLQLVAQEPMVQDPVVIVFDPDGRMWVVEMRGFMQDIDGHGEDQRVGRISILEDTDGDGVMDVSKIYIDSLIMPRALALVPGGALIAENGSLWLTQDTDNDLHADTKMLIDSTYAGGPSPEHSGNGLFRNMDNWYYNAKSKNRYQLQNGKWVRDTTELRGQWGISNDDGGRLYYNYNWSQLHADLVPPNYLSANKHHTATTGIDHGLTLDRRVYPIRPNPAVNRGYIPGTLNKEGRLQEFTAACSPLYYRGTALPAEYYGNVFVCEPSGNLVKRNVVEQKGLMVSAHDSSPGKEFLASTDERFRPVFISNGPDGALYVVDMYRGLIQHGSYVTPYLREQTIERKLARPVNHGRIWRIVPTDWKSPAAVKLSAASVSTLISTLSDPIGWRRDMAQKLLVEKGDRNSERLLRDVITNGKNDLARFHALWAMEGLEINDPDLLLSLLKDHNTLVRTTAMRLIEQAAIHDEVIRARLGRILLLQTASAPVEEVLQTALTARVLDPQTSRDVLKGIVDRYDTSALMRDAVLSSLQDQELPFLQALWKTPSWQQQSPSAEVFIEMLTTAIVRAGKPEQLTQLLSMIDGRKDAKDFSWKENSVLTGIAIQGKNTNTKPVKLKSIPSLLISSSITNTTSPWNSLTEMFEWPGHTVDAAKAKMLNSLNEKEQKQFVSGRQLYLTTCGGCHGTDGNGLARFAPPLNGSDWVKGDDKRLALVLLHGMEGPVDVNGKHYDAPDILPVMPAHSTLDDVAITSILMYIRNAWSNSAGPVSAKLVGTTRITSQGRVIPWTAPELNKHMTESKDVKR